MSPFSDLLTQARGGDADALRVLYETYRQSVADAARRGMGPRLRSRVESVDVSQSVFGDMLRELPAFEDRGEPAFRAWLLTKVRNKLRTKARRTVRADGRSREERLSTAVADRTACAAPGPDVLTQGLDDRQRLCRLLGTLDSSQREVIGLHLDEGLPWSDVAQRLGLASADAARMRYVRALAVLRERWTRE